MYIIEGQRRRRESCRQAWVRARSALNKVAMLAIIERMSDGPISDEQMERRRRLADLSAELDALARDLASLQD